MIYKQLLGALESLGLQEIEACGKPFDPNYHNAVTHVEDENVGEMKSSKSSRRATKI